MNHHEPSIIFCFSLKKTFQKAEANESIINQWIFLFFFPIFIHFPNPAVSWPPGEFPVPPDMISTAAAMEPPPLEAVAPEAPAAPEPAAPDLAPVAVQVVKLPVTRHGDVVVVGRSKFGRKGNIIFQDIYIIIIIYCV